MDLECPKLKKVAIKGYRSIDSEGIELSIPTLRPLVLIGENNAGKSNILNALSLVLGESWTGNHNPEDHEFYGRSPIGSEIDIRVTLDGMKCPRCTWAEVSSVYWTYIGGSSDKATYGIDSECNHNWMSNDIKSMISCVLIGTDRGLDYQLSYKSKWTTLSKLMHSFHTQLIEDEERVAKLREYHDSLISVFNEVDSFKIFTESLEEYAKEFSGNMPYGLDMNFSAYDPSNFFHSLRLSPFLNGQARSFDELGTGQAQVLAIAFAFAYSRTYGSQGLVLLIEEPESHLHPLAQEWFSSRIEKLVSSGCQVIISTHSPYFIDLSVPGSYAIVRKGSESDSTKVIQLKAGELVSALVGMGAPAKTVDARNVGEFYEASATAEIKAGLFARGCVLVEGDTEKFGLSVLLRRIGIDPVRKGIAIVPVEGLNNIAKWVRFFRAHGTPVFVIFDSDSNQSGNDAKKSKKTRLDIFGALGLETSLDWNERPHEESDGAGKYFVLDQNYESWMRNGFGSEYQRLESEATELFGTSKSLRARWCAEQLTLSDDIGRRENGWDSVSDLANSILIGLGRQESVSPYGQVF